MNTNSLIGSSVIDDVVDLADQMTNPVLLKDTNGRYVYANSTSIELFGFSKQSDLLGINAKESYSRVEHRWHREYELAIQLLDNYVVSERRAGCDNMRVIPCQDGTLRVQNMIKKPMVSRVSDKVTSIFTFSESLTDNIDRVELLRLYIKFYSSNKLAIGYFLKYLSVEGLFLKTPSLREMETLLHLSLYGCQKAVSNKMGISVRTVEENIRKIKQVKLRDDYLWVVLLELIRNDKRKIKIT